MSHLCHQYREQWLERPLGLGGSVSHGPSGGVGEHGDGCPECAAWVRRTTTVVRALSGLPTRSAPPELMLRVENECADPARRIAVAARSLPDLGAPPELAERLFPLATAAAPRRVEPLGVGEASLAVQAVRALDHLSAPAVLDRLVEEELRNPAACRANRFAGDLERLHAPRVLDSLVQSRLAGRFPTQRWTVRLLALAAALVLAWIGVQRWGGSGVPEAPRSAALPGSAYERYSFVVERSSSNAELHPIARSLAETMGGTPRRSG